MRFMFVIKAMQALRLSAVVFGVLGAVAAGSACAAPPADEDEANASVSDDKATKDGPTAKRAQAFSKWETSGGASEEDPGGYPYCDQGQAFVGTGRAITGGYMAACNEAKEEALSECEATECWDRSQHKLRSFDCDPDPNACHWTSTWYGWYATFHVDGD